MEPCLSLSVEKDASLPPRHCTTLLLTRTSSCTHKRTRRRGPKGTALGRLGRSPRALVFGGHGSSLHHTQAQSKAEGRRELRQKEACRRRVRGRIDDYYQQMLLMDDGPRGRLCPGEEEQHRRRRRATAASKCRDGRGLRAIRAARRRELHGSRYRYLTIPITIPAAAGEHGPSLPSALLIHPCLLATDTTYLIKAVSSRAPERRK